MNELSLFTGAGGGVLGSVLLGWRTVCGVEIDPYCREILLRRQEEGHIPPFPIWDDIRTFVGKSWRGHVDIITAGFPCQPWSSARHGTKTGDNLWPETARVIEEVCPSFVMLENVIGIKRYLEVVRSDLQGMGYCVHPPAVVAAAAVGAPHPRERAWIFAHTDKHGKPTLPINGETPGVPQTTKVDWWEKPPCLDGMGDGLAGGVEQTRAIGNGQVPAVVEAAWELLGDK